MEFDQQPPVSKILSQSDVTSKLVVMEEWLGNLLPGNLEPGSETNILAVDEWGNEFTFILKVRRCLDIDLNREPRPYYYKPEFKAKGWQDFARQRELMAGQTIWFWKRADGRIGVRVEAEE